MSDDARQRSPWDQGSLPENVRAGVGTAIIGDLAFKRFYAKLPEALVIGEGCTMELVHFDVGPKGRMVVGNYCYFTNAVLLCEDRVEIGNYVVIGWNTTIADSDFHPIEPAKRMADAIACSPLGKGQPRPPIATQPVIIEDNVWIGPQVTILKGVRIGHGAWIEPGSVITRDVPPMSRMMGNPARLMGPVSA